MSSLFSASPDFLVAHAALTFAATLGMGALCLLMPRSRLWFHILLALWLPGTVLALWLPSLLFTPTLMPREPIPSLVSIIQGFLLCPTFTLPVLGTLLDAPSELARTAFELGAGRTRRVTLLWLPLLRGCLALGMAASVALSILMAFALAWRLQPAL
ncbi:hypothetical protein [Acetobacter estunensis]|uniref:hypothetical protein n=1 Tax=Acetobacter estunensis TaxID=104097 RepID=UPI001C2D4F5A|nr:hypothetical protein [Acetobacter estunensis]MBV1837405.1 hypothetical protein [Acetobacter estunensis]